MTIEAKLDEVNKNLLALGVKLDALAAAAGKPAKGGAKSDTPAALTYDDVKKPFLDLIKTHTRDVAIPAIQTVDPSFKSLKDAENKPELFPALLKAVQEAAAKPAPAADA